MVQAFLNVSIKGNTSQLSAGAILESSTKLLLLTDTSPTTLLESQLNFPNYKKIQTNPPVMIIHQKLSRSLLNPHQPMIN